MGGEVVGVDGLELLVLVAGRGVLVLLVVGEAELAPGVAWSVDTAATTS